MQKFIIFFGALLFTGVLFSQQKTRSLNSEKWEFKNTTDKQWLKAEVPGTVHTDLMANDEIPDPYLDENEEDVQWVEEEDWEYQTKFGVSADELKNNQIVLVFDGLDTYARVWLNGQEILSADNMFRQWHVPVKKYLKKGENQLKIEFKSSIKVGNEKAKEVAFETPESPRAFVRKAQYQFGWDWGPRLVTAGVWKDVNLEFWNNAKLENVQIDQKVLNEKIAKLDFNIEVKAEKAGRYRLTINGDKEKEVKLKKGLNEVTIPYNVKEPKLWQPNGWGKPNLYDYNVELSKGNIALDSESMRHGFRTIELVQKDDEAGRSFYFKVNGKPLYIKGTNWIPGDMFLPRITKEKYHQLIEDVKDAHMNMIRIWGGGIYEDEELYDAADENGILVWQDFMFAGSFYPSDDDFLENVKEEVKYQVKRLQKHPSIALYCGNNEIDEAIVNWGYQKQFDYSKEDSLQVWKDYRKVFHELIPETLDEVLPESDNIYWPTSPELGWGHIESLQQGDSHYWGVWHGGEPLETYDEKVGRFMSEYGFQGMPSLEAIKAMFSGKPDLSLDDPIIRAHQKHLRGWEIISDYMPENYVVPEDFGEYNYVSQLLQARGMRIAIEAHRRNQPYNMGTLIWQLNDVWPVTSWSTIDYLGNWKALQYQTKRSYAPQTIFAHKEDDELNVYVINDNIEELKNPGYEVSLINFKGETLKKVSKNYKHNKTVENILKMESNQFRDLLSSDINEDEVFLKLVLKNEKGRIITENTHFLSKPKDLKLSEPNINIKRISDNEIEITTDVLAKNVYLKGDTHFSDNYFDLLPHKKKKITLTEPIDDIEVMSLWDTMN